MHPLLCYVPINLDYLDFIFKPILCKNLIILLHILIHGLLNYASELLQTLFYLPQIEEIKILVIRPVKLIMGERTFIAPAEVKWKRVLEII